MVQVMATASGKRVTGHERNSSPDKGFPWFAFGIIRSGKKSIVFSKPFGSRLKDAAQKIPHLDPLPLRKGEEDCDVTFTHWSRNREPTYRPRQRHRLKPGGVDIFAQ